MNRHGDLFCVLRIVGFICIAYLAIAKRHNCIYFLILVGIMTDWDFFDFAIFDGTSRNWFVTAFLVAPFLIGKATDDFLAPKGKPAE